MEYGELVYFFKYFYALSVQRLQSINLNSCCCTVEPKMNRLSDLNLFELIFLLTLLSFMDFMTYILCKI